MQYLINIPQAGMESNILSLLQKQGVQYVKLDAFFSEGTQKDVIDLSLGKYIIPAEEEGDVTMLFGKWADMDISPENYRNELWRKIEF